LNDLRIFNPEKNEWKYIQTLSQQQISARRYHTAAIYERFMYVYAGVSKEGYYLKDLWTLHLSILFLLVLNSNIIFRELYVGKSANSR